jgi:hypothetical protein
MWSCSLKVQSVVVDTAVNYKANLVFPSPSSLVSSFVVTDGEYIFLFNPSSPKVPPRALFNSARAHVRIEAKPAPCVAHECVEGGEVHDHVGGVRGHVEPAAGGTHRLLERQVRTRLPRKEAR